MQLLGVHSAAWPLFILCFVLLWRVFCTMLSMRANARLTSKYRACSVEVPSLQCSAAGGQQEVGHARPGTTARGSLALPRVARASPVRQALSAHPQAAVCCRAKGAALWGPRGRPERRVSQRPSRARRAARSARARVAE